MTELTDQERIERLEWAVASLTENLTRNFPVRSHDIGVEDLRALAADVRTRAESKVADARRQVLQNELGELGGTVAR